MKPNIEIYTPKFKSDQCSCCSSPAFKIISFKHFSGNVESGWNVKLCRKCWSDTLNKMLKIVYSKEYQLEEESTDE